MTSISMRTGQLPKQVATLELTFNCNFTCPFCYLPWIDHPELYGREQSEAFWMQTIDHLVAEGIEEIEFTGGEPLLSKSLAPAILHIKENHPEIRFSVYTNASLLDDHLLSLFENSKGAITTSLQSVKNYANWTGSEVSFEQWKHGCQLIRSRGIPFSIAITISKGTMGERTKMLNEALSLRPSRVLVNPIMIEGRAKYHPSLWLSHADHLAIRKMVNKARRRTAIPILFSEETHCLCRSDAIIPEGTPILSDNHCTGCYDLIVIGPDGRQRKCLHTFETIGWDAGKED